VMIFISALLALAQAIPTEKLEALHNGWQEEKNDRLMPREQVGLLVDGGWYPFQFGGVNTTAKDAFIFKTSGPAVMKVTDNYCAGDAFFVFDNGVYIGRTSHVMANSCRTNTTNPDVAWNDPSFSHGSFTLEPGLHKIQFTVAESPFMAGGANLRVDSSLLGCPTQSPSGFHIIQSPVPFSAAAAACRTFGMELADLDIYNFLEVTDLAFHCSGPFSQSWIRSYWGDTYGGSCLVLSTGNMSPGGAINVPVSCNTALPVVCRVTKGCQQPPARKPGCTCDFSSSSSSWSSCTCGSSSSGTTDSSSCPPSTSSDFWTESYMKQLEAQKPAAPIPAAQ